MTVSIFFLVISAFLLSAILIIRAIELRTDNSIIPLSIRRFADKAIKVLLLAVLKNTVKIIKIIRREVTLMPNRCLRITHFVWLKIKRSIDKFYEKLHR